MSANRAREIFIELVANVPPEQREGRLVELAGQDAELRRKVAGLLAAHQKADSFLEQPAGPLGGMVDDAPVTNSSGQPSPEPDGTEQPGLVLAGRYKLLEAIGEGGMGTVWMAQQTEPVRRLVAVKLVKAGLNSKAVLARFEAERQALALMDHPHIAKVLDAGAGPDGRPFFVMELVKGVPITQYCDEHRLTPRERLELFVPACQAIQHAHQKGVIHRDIKPSNVLVALYDERPVVKVIDFGVAKATAQPLTERTLHTGFGAVVGTLEYMSPEQASFNQLDVDTRSDVYALGVLLYELLAGSPPFTRRDLEKAGMLELLRVIREQEPAKPSTRLSTAEGLPTLAANRGTEPKRLTALVRGELDWIVMKALEKDRNRRYETANGLAQDVERYLRDEPVQAGPPSALYRFRKFARRHKAALRTASILAVALLLAVAALAASTVLIWRANQDLHQALARERDTSERELRVSYFQRIALADREWSANNLSRMEELLEQCPSDLRGWEWNYLKRLRSKGLPPLRHDSAVLCAVFSSDGRWIASSGHDGAVKIWDARTGQELVQFQAHKHYATSVAFSPDNQCLATTGRYDGTVKLWDAETGQLLRTLEGHQAAVTSVKFSPDGRRLVSAGGWGRQPGEVKVWDAVTGQELFTLTGHTAHVKHVTFSPNGQLLATTSGDTTVRVWDAQTGQERLTFRGHSQPVMKVAFSPDGQWLASAACAMATREPGELKVWEVQTGREVWNLRGHVSLVFCVAFSPDGRRLASAGFDQTVKLWDLSTGQEALTLRGHLGAWITTVEFSPDGHRLLSACYDRTVRVWDATPVNSERGEEILTLRGHRGGVRSVAFHPDGRCLASASDDKTVKIWDTQTGRELHTLDGYNGIQLSLAFNRQGTRLALGGQWLRVWDATSCSVLHTFPTLTNAVAFSPDGRYFVSNGGGLYALRLRDATTFQEIHTLPAQTWGLFSASFSPDSRYLASASGDSAVRLWDVAAGTEIKAPALRHGGPAISVAFSPDGRRLASGSQDRTVKVWDTSTWHPLHTFHDASGSVQSVAFHPDSRRLAWGGMDATVKVGDAASGAVVQTLRGHTGWVESVAFSPDGQWLASASLDGTVKIWKTPALAEGSDPMTGGPDK